jgi:glycosyltransferase involved in cell wall biosynthesis
MTDPAFTILLPVNRPPALLPYAIASVLAQERRDFELFVICDGAPPETAEVARRHAAEDPRIRVFEHPKGERHGEIYRDQALREARGEFVCQLGDDDLWLPNHLSEMAALLEQCDFGNLAQVEIRPDDRLELLAGNLADSETRQAIMSEPCNFFGPTATGYRLTAYRTLPIGWSPAPLDVATDLFMWRKFLAREGLRFGSRVIVTSVKFSAQYRRDWSLDQRRAEIADWAAQLSRPAERSLIAQRALLRLSHSVFILERHVAFMGRGAKDKEARIADLEDQLRRTDQTAKDQASRIANLEDQLRAIDKAAKDEATRIAYLEHRLWIMDKAATDTSARTAELEDRLRQSRAALRDSTRRSDELYGKLEAMRRSWSWRWTRPFRKLARRIAR